jgi:C4-dicarboxylate-specific signal transduction histidine kinase
MNDMRPKVDSTRDQAAKLMANRGDHCRKVVEPQISELNRRFAAISHRIKTGKVGRSTSRWKLVLNDLLRRLRNTLKGARNPHNKVLKRKMKMKPKIYLRKFCH